MEQTLFISNLSGLKYFQEDFTRIYFGQEFCERLLPSQDDIEKVCAFSERENVHLTLVTPYVTDKGLLKVEKLIELFADKMPGAEVVFNDWGVFQFFKEKGLDVKPVLGRLLNKQKRGPRLRPPKGDTGERASREGVEKPAVRGQGCHETKHSSQSRDDDDQDRVRAVLSVGRYMRGPKHHVVERFDEGHAEGVVALFRPSMPSNQ